MAVKKQELLGFLESLAPLSLCESWDNCGLLVDAGNDSFSRVLLSLDATEQVAREAVERGCDLLLTHHPILFKGVRRISQGDPQGRFIATLLKGGVSHYAAHTNLDSAKSGVNAVLGQKLGLHDVSVLRKAEWNAKKIAVFVPAGDADRVFDAMAKAGAGKLGNYAMCSFRTLGEGTFLPLAGAHPAVGSVGTLERVDEVRLETVVPVGRLQAALSAMLAAHPYEVPAFDVYPLELNRPDEGMGRIGMLENPQTLGEFAKAVKTALNADSVRVAGELTRPVQRIAVCGGSGYDLIDDALAQGADVLVTGDVKHHQALEAIERGIAIVDAGHFATEAPIIYSLFNCLQEQFDRVQYKVEFYVTCAGVSAMQSI